MVTPMQAQTTALAEGKINNFSAEVLDVVKLTFSCIP